MNTLSKFSEKERQYFEYQARQEYLREQRSIELERQAIRVELEKRSVELEEKSVKLQEASRELLQVKQREEAALAEIERLKSLIGTKNQ